MLIGALYFILVLLILVFIHEFGHYFVAKKCGVKIEEFSIGMGKKLFGFKDKSGTEWKICCLPIGGYVKMFGDDNASSFGGYSENPSKELLQYSLIYKHPLKKIAVAFAGPFVNLVFAFLLFTFIFTIKGLPTFLPIVGDVKVNSVADKIGIKKGDKIISINGKRIKTFYDIGRNLNTKDLNIEVSRTGGKKMEFSIKNFGKNQQLGISGNAVFENVLYEKIGFLSAVKYGWSSMFSLSVETFKVVFNMVFHQSGIHKVGGPIAIAKESSKAGKRGFWSFCYFLAILSVSLGAINLLPIPMLDGGHILINSIELITRRKFGNFAYKIFVVVGLVFISSLMLIGFVNDIFFRN